jgi:hypothetical protein
MPKTESPQKRNRRVRAQLEIAFINSGSKIIRGQPNSFGFMEKLLDPVAILQYIGTSQEIKECINTVEKASAINRDCPTIPDAEREANGERFDALLKRLRYLERAARQAEEILAKAGARFDSATRKVKIRTGGRDAFLLTRCIQTLGIKYGDDPKGRGKIKDCLESIFDEDLDAGPRGNIKKALESLKK